MAPGERLVTVEDTAELRFPGDHVVRLEARPATADGLGAVTIRQLVRNALRMRPDRIIVGEVRGAEAVDMLWAMNTGHEGSLSTCHANSPVDALRRLEVMVLTAALDLPLEAVRDQMAAALDLVVHVARLPGGHRGVVAVAEVARSPIRPRRRACESWPIARGLRALPVPADPRRRGAARRRGVVPVKVLADWRAGSAGGATRWRSSPRRWSAWRRPCGPAARSPRALVEVARSSPPALGGRARHRRPTRSTTARASMPRSATWRHAAGPSAEVALAATALGLGGRAGGEVARALDRVAATLRERRELRAEVRALATQARASAGILIGAPRSGSPRSCPRSSRTWRASCSPPQPGVACLALGLALDGVGAAWMARIVDRSS